MDALTLYGPGGASPIQLGSYILADPGIDFGEKGHLEPHVTESAALAGGAFAFQQTHARRWTIPLLVGSGGAIGLSRDQIESLIRLNAVTGGYVDFTPGNVPSQAPVRFDLLAGQWEPDYKVRVNELARRQGNLMLQTQPYGYWPTWITLGSAASIGMPGFLPVSGGSIFGDVAGFGEVILSPTVSGSPYTNGSLAPDVLIWSARTNASFQPWLTAGSWLTPSGITTNYAASLGGPGPTGMLIYGGTLGWQLSGYYTISAALEPAYRGRFNAFALMRNQYFAPSAGYSAQVGLDAVGDAGGPGLPFASAAVIATVAPFAMSSAAEHLIPLGKVNLPPVGSGLTQPVRLRLWMVGLGGPIEFGGLYLMPADAPGGVLARGLTVPSVALGSTGVLALDSYERSVMIASPTGLLEQRIPITPAPNYRGAFPVVGSTLLGIDIFGAARLRGYAWSYRQEVLADVPDLYYTFQASSFPTMIDYSGNQHVGSWGPLGGLTGQASSGIRAGLDDGAVYASSPVGIPTGIGMFAAPAANYFASQWTVELWAQGDGGIPGPVAGPLLSNAVGASVALDTGWTIGLDAPTAISGASQTKAVIFSMGGADLISYALTFNNNNGGAGLRGPRAHIVAQWFAASKGMSLYVNGSLVGSQIAAGSYKGGTQTLVGVLGYLASNGAVGYRGVIDDVALYPFILSPSRVAAHFVAGASGVMSVATDNMLYQPMSAQATLRFRPAFAFMKGL